MKLPDRWSRAVPVFDDEHLVSCAGLVPVMGLAEQTGLAELIGDRVRFKTSRVASAGANPAGKLTAIIAGMVAGADCIDDLDLIRCGGMRPAVRRRVRPGHAGPAPAGVHPRPHPAAGLGAAGPSGQPGRQRPVCCPGSAEQVFVDIDSLLRPTFGHAKQGASYGHTKIAGKQVLRKGLSPLAATILSTPTGAPVIAGIRLRAGRAGSGKGAASMVTDAIRVARAAGAAGEVMVRGDSAYGNSAVVRACRASRGPVLPGAGEELDRSPRRSRAFPTTPGPRSTTPARSPIQRPVSDQRRRGRRGTRVHRVRLHPASGHRPADRAPGP